MAVGADERVGGGAGAGAGVGGEKATVADAAAVEVEEEQPREVQDWDWVMAEGEAAAAAADEGAADAGSGSRGQKRGRRGAASRVEVKATAQQTTVSAPSTSLSPPLAAPQRPPTSSSSSPTSPLLSSSASSPLTLTATARSAEWARLIGAAATELHQPSAVASPALSLLSSLLSSLPDEAVSSTSLQEDDPVASLWSHLPALYDAVVTCPRSAPPTLFALLLSALLGLACSRPALVLLARTQAEAPSSSSSSSASSASSAASSTPLLLADDATAREEEEKRLQSARRYCLWSTLTAAIQLRWSSASSPLLRPLYGLCASLYPSTLSLLYRYGDQTGTVGPALDAVRLHLRSNFLTPHSGMQLMPAGTEEGSSTLLPLFRSALPLLRVILLTHSPLDPVESSDSAAPSPHALVSLKSSSSASSASLFPSPSASTTLVSFPVVVSERPLYLPSLSPFSISAVSPSHPDLDSAELQAEVAAWMAHLTHSITLATQAFTSTHAASASVYLSLVQDTLLFITRQRSHAYHGLVVPALLSFAEALTSHIRHPPPPPSPSFLTSSQSSSMLHLLRLGLFSLFRLQSCASHFTALSTLLSQPNNSILAMETGKINKQRLQQHPPPQHSLTHSLPSPALPQAANTPSLPTPPSASASLLAMAALSEAVQLSATSVMEALTSSSRLPLLSIVHLVLGVLYRSPALQPPPPSVAPQPAILALAIALLQQRADALIAASPHVISMEVQDQGMAATASSALPSTIAAASPSAPASGGLSLPASSSASPASFLSLSVAELSSLSRASFVRLLSLSTAEEVAQQQGGGLRTALLTALATRTTGDGDILLTLTLPSRAALRSLQAAIEGTAEGEGKADELSTTLLSSLSLTSSLTSSPLFGALLNDVLTDLHGRYEVALALLYRLAQLTPPPTAAATTRPPPTTVSHHSAITWRIEVNEEEEEEEQQDGQEELQGADDVPPSLEVDGSDGGSPESVQSGGGRVEDSLQAVDSSAAAASLSRKRRFGEEQIQDDGEAATKTPKLGKAEGEDADRNTGDPMTASMAADDSMGEGQGDAVWTASELQRSPSFHALMFAHLRRVGGVEYGEVVSSLLAAFDSRLFIEDAAAKPQTEDASSTSSSSPSAPFSLRFCRLFVQFLLDLPLLPPLVWSTLSRYTEQAATAAVAFHALQGLLTFRPPAAASALNCLLDCLRHSQNEEVRQRAVRLAVEIACRRSKDKTTVAAVQAMDDGAETQLSLTTGAFLSCAAIVDCALALASASSSPSFLADLPSITVNIVVPPVPVYEQIQVKQDQPPPPLAQPGGATFAAESNIGDSAAVSASTNGGDDGSDDADEARRREIQSLIAAAARRQREFDKLVLRRALLIKEKEALEVQAKEREEQRTRRTHRHLDLFMALLTHSAMDGAPLASHAPRLFDGLFALYQAAAASDPARKAVHQALPGVIARTGPSLGLLQGIRSTSSGADACVLHCLQLLCNNPLEPSHPPFAAPSSISSTSSSSSSVLVYATSSVYSLCWELYTSRQGDARFIIPILPIVRGDQLRRCLHRLVLLPPAHLKVAFTRLLKPTASLHAKGNKLSTFTPNAAPQHSTAALSPAELVIALHRIDHARRVQLLHPPPPSSPPDPATLFPADDSVWLRSLISACQLCYSLVELFPPPVFLSILTALRSDRPLSRLLMRTALQVLSLYPALTSFLLDLTAHLMQTERQMVEQGAMWEGALKLAQLTLPQSLDLLLQLPDPALEKLFKGYSPPTAAEDGTSSPLPPSSKSVSPLVQCRAAVVLFVTSNPFRVRPYLRAKVLGGGGEAGDGAASAAAQMQGRHPPGPAQMSALHAPPSRPPPMYAPHLPPPPPGVFPVPSTAAGGGASSSFSAAAPMRPASAASSTGWSSSSLRPAQGHLPPHLPPPAPYPPQPPPFHASGAPYPPSPYYPQPLGALPSAPPTGGPPSTSLSPFSVSSAVSPAPSAPGGGGWKSVRIPAGGSTASTAPAPPAPTNPPLPTASHIAPSEAASQPPRRSRR